MMGYVIKIFLVEKWLNRLQTVKTVHSAASDLGQHCLLITLMEVYGLKWIKDDKAVHVVLIELKFYGPINPLGSC